MTPVDSAIKPGGRKPLAQLAGPWWMFLLTGIGWLLISFIVLRFSLVSVAAVGTLVAVVLFIGAISEVTVASARPTWRWAHIAMAVLFFLGALWALINPVGAFW